MAQLVKSYTEIDKVLRRSDTNKYYLTVSDYDNIGNTNGDSWLSFNSTDSLLNINVNESSVDVVYDIPKLNSSGELLPELNKVSFDTTYTVTGSEAIGSIYWNSASDTLDIVCIDGVIIQSGQELAPLFRNGTGSDIDPGTFVGFDGTVGASGRVKMKPFISDGVDPAYYALGIMTNDSTITNGNDGHVTAYGAVRKMDTTGDPYGEEWFAEDIIYSSQSTAGYLTKVEPSSQYPRIVVGTVIYSDTNVGALAINPKIVYAEPWSDEDIYGSWNFQLYTKLGSDAPAIKQKLISGTTSSTVSTAVDVAHGLTRSKILSYDFIIDTGSLSIHPQHGGSVAFYYEAYINDTNVHLTNGDSATSILSKPFTVLITYQE